MNFFITKKMLVAVVLLLCGILIAIWLTGCGEVRSALNEFGGPGLPGKGALFGREAPPLKNGETALDQAMDNRAFWDARIAVEQEKGKRDKAEERQRWLERICRAVIVICFIGVLANAALFVLSFKFDWFGSMRKVALAGIAANIIIICLVWFIPGYIGYVAGVVVLGAGITAIALIRNMHGLGREVRSAKDAVTTVVKKVI